MMNKEYDYDYCSITWYYKSFAVDTEALLGCGYMYYVRKRIEDPMNQKFKREMTMVALSIVIAIALSTKSYEIKCRYISRSLFNRESYSSIFAVMVEFWNMIMIPLLIWNRLEI